MTTGGNHFEYSEVHVPKQKLWFRVASSAMEDAKKRNLAQVA